MSPVGSICSIKPVLDALDEEAVFDVKATQGYAPFGVEWRIVDDEGRELPHDGTTFGRLQVRGSAVTKAYFRRDEPILTEDGFFDTGDVATLDEHGYMRITDRSKDVIKSGGEWISSIDLENLAVAHPDVAEAAVIGIHHPKWDERPLLVVVPKPGREPGKDELLEFMRPKIARWWMPDDVVLVDAIPHTATGKILKTALREQFRDYRLPTA
jgi:fatty-acyl-CoA synthase